MPIISLLVAHQHLPEWKRALPSSTMRRLGKKRHHSAQSISLWIRRDKYGIGLSPLGGFPYRPIPQRIKGVLVAHLEQIVFERAELSEPRGIGIVPEEPDGIVECVVGVGLDPSRQHRSFTVTSRRKPSSTMWIFSSGVYLRRVAALIRRTKAWACSVRSSVASALSVFQDSVSILEVSGITRVVSGVERPDRA